MTRSDRLLALVVTACALLVGRRAIAERQAPIATPAQPPMMMTGGVVAGTDTAPASAPTIEEMIGAIRITDLKGLSTTVVLPGTASVVMINSRTCPWCKKALHDIGTMSTGRRVPYLTVLSLEGAAEGPPMLAKERITGARFIGPADGNGQTALTFRVQGTPTFLAVDRRGRVVRTLPGYPIADEMRHWVAVMLGDSKVP